MSTTRHYTDEELSRILGEHAAGTLVPYGARNWEIDPMSCSMMPLKSERYPRGCVNQVAYDECDPWVAIGLNRGPARWFDVNYWRHTTPEELLAGLEEAARE